MYLQDGTKKFILKMGRRRNPVGFVDRSDINRKEYNSGTIESSSVDNAPLCATIERKKGSKIEPVHDSHGTLCIYVATSQAYTQHTVAG